MSLILECKDGGDFKPHPEGIHPAVCVDVIDLGLMETEFQGQKRMVNKLRVVFESEQKTEDGRNCTISKNFTASLHPNAKLTEFLGKWRGRPVLPGESIDLAKLMGACCTLVVSHQQNLSGKTYAGIDAVSKPTRKLTPSGGYDPAAARQRIAEWKAKQTRNAEGGTRRESGTTDHGPRPAQAAAGGTPNAPAARPSPVPPGHPLPFDGRGADKRAAPATVPAAPAFDPEVGF